MAYQNYEPETSMSSKFNAGILQMERLHDLQALINKANSNLTAFNLEYNIYNYELLLASLNSLYQEVRPKLKKEERIAGDLFRFKLMKAMEEYPIHEDKKDIITKKTNSILNKSNLQVHRRYLIEYESLIRDMMDKHSFNSPTEDDEGL